MLDLQHFKDLGVFENQIFKIQIRTIDKDQEGQQEEEDNTRKILVFFIFNFLTTSYFLNYFLRSINII